MTLFLPKKEIKFVMHDEITQNSATARCLPIDKDADEILYLLTAWLCRAILLAAATAREGL